MRGDRESTTDSEHDHLLFGDGGIDGGVDDDSDAPVGRHGNGRHESVRNHDAYGADRGDAYGADRGDAYGDDRLRTAWLADDADPETRSDGRRDERGRRGSRLEARRRSRRRRRRSVFALAGSVVVILLVAAAYFIALPAYRYFNPADYSGDGTGRTVVTIAPNADAGQIADVLVAGHVVASTKAFVNAADANSNSQNIQPGSYRLHQHMSAKDAITALLAPANRLNTDLVVTEGATSMTVAQRLAAPRCTSSSPSGTVCGLSLSSSSVAAALKDTRDLGLPTDFTVDGHTPSSAEGFLFPATYAFADTTTARDALQTMVSQFTDAVRGTDFTAQAAALHITPYQELIIASIAQSEALYPADMAKVATVILNRLRQHIDLRIDATSAYAYRLEGLDPAKYTYATAPGPYNTYTHSGLPPTPISNPGTEALNAAAHPTAGNWLYYVNEDAAGHLFFTNSVTAFEKAAAKCAAEHWGCG